MKSSFAKVPGAKPPGVPTKTAPKPAASSAVPAKKLPGKANVPAKAVPAKVAPKPVPTRQAPAGVKTNVPAKAVPKKAVARPVPPEEVEQEEVEVLETEVVETEVEQEETEVVETEVEAEQEEALVVYDPENPPIQSLNILTAPLGSGLGEIDASDIGVPKIKLMQPLSPLVVEGTEDGYHFTPGDWVLNSDTILWQPDCEAIEVTVLKLQKQYTEQKEFGGEMPRIFNTAEEAKAAGLVAFGGDDVGYTPTALAVVLIKRPEGCESGEFVHEYGDDAYAVAMWNISGLAYKYAGKKLWREHLQGRLKEGFHLGSFKMEAKLEKGTRGSYWIPVLKLHEMHDGDFVEWLTALDGATVEEE